MINPDAKVKYCPSCFNNDITQKNHLGTYTIYKGFIAIDTFSNLCPTCKGFLKSMNLTLDEWKLITEISVDKDFIIAMDKLKQDDIITFTTKIKEFKEARWQKYLEEKSLKTAQQNIPKCPTCGSTNIKKISGTKRFVSTGIFGLGSSNVGKSFECCNCGYKW